MFEKALSNNAVVKGSTNVSVEELQKVAGTTGGLLADLTGFNNEDFGPVVFENVTSSEDTFKATTRDSKVAFDLTVLGTTVTFSATAQGQAANG